MRFAKNSSNLIGRVTSFKLIPWIVTNETIQRQLIKLIPKVEMNGNILRFGF
jgi:hypothetical protein